MDFFIQKGQATPFPYNLLMAPSEGAIMEGAFTLYYLMSFFPEQREITDKEMLILASRGGSFDFLNDQRENIYTEADGTPL